MGQLGSSGLSQVCEPHSRVSCDWRSSVWFPDLGWALPHVWGVQREQEVKAEKKERTQKWAQPLDADRPETAHHQFLECYLLFIFKKWGGSLDLWMKRAPQSRCKQYAYRKVWRTETIFAINLPHHEANLGWSTGRRASCPRWGHIRWAHPRQSPSMREIHVPDVRDPQSRTSLPSPAQNRRTNRLVSNM